MTYTNDRWDWPKKQKHLSDTAQQDAGAAAHIERATGAIVPPGSIPFNRKVGIVFGEAHDLLLKKHKDYGPKNISQSPGGPLNGLRVRMHDKTARLNHLIDSGNEPNHESIEDTLLDLANYALIGILVLRGQWPSE